MKSKSGDSRFAFGRNWRRFLSLLSEDRIERAEASLRNMLNTDNLTGRRFLDIGSGSGLFSLAARRLGAQVHSFDYDVDSVNCTAELRRRFFPDDSGWVIEQGSVLDESYIDGLGTHDIVYSWGVLHHTGQMWRAIELAAATVADTDQLFIAIYNRQTPLRHKMIVGMKRLYVRGTHPVRVVLVTSYFVFATSLEILASLLKGRGPLFTIRRYAETSRGMSWWHDIVDWVGGYPYEAARPEEIIDFLRARGFKLERLTTQAGHGCNEFVFARERLNASLTSPVPQ